MLLSDLADVQGDCQRLVACRPQRKALAGSEDLEPMECWHASESERAAEYVRLYEASTSKCGWWDFVCHLGDDPRAQNGWRTWSCKSNRLPTIRRSCGLYAMPAAHRHLTVREIHASMGFPVTAQLSSMVGVPTYDPWRADLTHVQSRQALGNSQVVPQVGCITACLLACTRYRQQRFDESMGLEAV